MDVRSNPYESHTPESIKKAILSELEGTVEIREGSFSNHLASPAAYQLWLVYQLVPWLMQLVFPDETGGELIDLQAADFGLTRTPGVKARVTLEFTALMATASPSVPAGTTVVTRDGLKFITLEDAGWSGGVGTALAEAAEIGRIYNVEADAITVMSRNVAGVSYCTNPAAAYGGADEETDVAFLARYKEYLQRPISSGNKNHYIAWAKEVSGVAYDQCVPIWDGPGTVKVIVAGPDKELVDEDVIGEAADHIEAERPIGADVTVVTVSELAVNVSATVTLTAGVTAQAVQAELEASLAEMLLELPFGEATLVRWSRCLALLLDCEGVEDYSAFTVNGGTTNLSVTQEQTPVVGTVTITEGS